MRRAVLAHQAQALRDDDLEAGKAGDGRIALQFVAGEEDAFVLGPQQQEGLLEARLEAGEEGDIAEMLAVGVDDEPVAPGALVRRFGAGLEGCGRDMRLRAERAEIGERNRA